MKYFEYLSHIVPYRIFRIQKPKSYWLVAFEFLNFTYGYAPDSKFLAHFSTLSRVHP